MFDFEAICPHCEEKYKINRISPEATEFIRCPHCRKVIKLNLEDPEKTAVRTGPEFSD